jgi:ABC-2 type transport system ATP-binding protein
MTVAETLALRSRLFDRWDAARAGAIAASLGLEMGARVGEASKGTLAKLAWVCAAAHDPELFLLDEPTSGLDALVREEVLSKLIEELQSAGKTLFISNHRMEELGGLLDEVWLLSGGVITEVFSVERLRREACRVAGRLKEGAVVPEAPWAVRLDSEAPLAAWAAFGDEAAQRILGSGALEAAEKTPLPLDEALKFLLKLGDGGRP